MFVFFIVTLFDHGHVHIFANEHATGERPVGFCSLDLEHARTLIAARRNQLLAVAPN
jgi:hypothetical protein